MSTITQNYKKNSPKEAEKKFKEDLQTLILMYPNIDPNELQQALLEFQDLEATIDAINDHFKHQNLLEEYNTEKHMQYNYELDSQNQSIFDDFTEDFSPQKNKKLQKNGSKYGNNRVKSSQQQEKKKSVYEEKNNQVMNDYQIAQMMQQREIEYARQQQRLAQQQQLEEDGDEEEEEEDDGEYDYDYEDEEDQDDQQQYQQQQIQQQIKARQMEAKRQQKQKIEEQKKEAEEKKKKITLSEKLKGAKSSFFSYFNKKKSGKDAEGSEKQTKTNNKKTEKSSKISSSSSVKNSQIDVQNDVNKENCKQNVNKSEQKSGKDAIKKDDLKKTTTINNKENIYNDFINCTSDIDSDDEIETITFTYN